MMLPMNTTTAAMNYTHTHTGVTAGHNTKITHRINNLTGREDCATIEQREHSRLHHCTRKTIAAGEHADEGLRKH